MENRPSVYCVKRRIVMFEKINKLQFDCVREIKESFQVMPTIGEMSLRLYKSENEVRDSVQFLREQGYLEGDVLTSKAEKLLEKHKIENAVILAAGMSSRFAPLCFERPKGLLEVNGEKLIERQICQLREKGINEIVVVVGYMKDAFKYLEEKYGVILVESPDFAVKNNYASVFAARDYLRNTIITSSDLYFSDNLFQTYAYDSYYCTVYQDGKTAERGIVTNQDDRIIKTMYGDKCYDIWVTLGYAFFNERFSKNYVRIVESVIDVPEYAGKFWADIQDENLDSLYMYAKRCSSDAIREFDSLEELREFDKTYCEKSDSYIMRQICRMLAVREGEIVKIKNLAPKMNGFSFECRDNSYICMVEPCEDDRLLHRGRVYYQSTEYKTGYVRLYKMDKSISLMKNQEFDTEKEIDDLFKLSKDFKEYHERALPLCAAENVISPFANLPLSFGFQERYIMNNTYSFNMDDNFVGCEKLFPFYQHLSDACERIFGAKYTDARPFTGMHCIDMIVKTVCNPGEKMMILDKTHGGHASVKPVVERLGIEVCSAPYNLAENEIDYDVLNEQVKREGIKYILLAPSDIIHPLHVERINTENCVLMWDCSQLMGLIAAGLIENPLRTMKNIIMFGGTHKTFPGPASGLILTNDSYLHELMEPNINPKLLRHSQMHQKVSLLFALVEFEKYGTAYMSHMVHCSNYLGARLRDMGHDIAEIDGKISATHQIFMRCSQEKMDTIYENAFRCEVTLNKKHKDLFNGYGIRLGTQEIARYDWDDEALDIIAEVVDMLSIKDVDSRAVRKLIDSLPPRTIHYAFSGDELKRFEELMAV